MRSLELLRVAQTEAMPVPMALGSATAAVRFQAERLMR